MLIWLSCRSGVVSFLCMFDTFISWTCISSYMFDAFISRTCISSYMFDAFTSWTHISSYMSDEFISWTYISSDTFDAFISWTCMSSSVLLQILHNRLSLGIFCYLPFSNIIFYYVDYFSLIPSRCAYVLSSFSSLSRRGRRFTNFHYYY